ncbi:MAG: aldehyde-activating protein [Oceanospirillaceae bacterium]
MLETSCHCGNVQIKTAVKIETVNSCNCSACLRFGTLWAHLDPKVVTITYDDNDLGSYCWGDKTITFHHCKNCACITHYTPTDIGNKDRMAINFRLAPKDMLDAVTVRYFDGADTWEYIEQ